MPTSPNSGCGHDTRSAGKGKRALADELRNKGVDDEVITAALDEHRRRRRTATGRAAGGDKLRRETLDGDDDVKVMRRLVAMLARRGYNQGMAVAVVAEVSAATGTPTGQ